MNKYEVTFIFGGVNATECIKELADLASKVARKHEVVLIGGSTQVPPARVVNRKKETHLDHYV